MQSQVSVANFKFFLSKNLNFSNEIQIFVYACLLKCRRWKAYENAQGFQLFVVRTLEVCRQKLIYTYIKQMTNYYYYYYYYCDKNYLFLQIKCL